MKTKVCIVGLGYWGSILVQKFDNLKNVELTVCDKDQDKILKIIKTYQDIKTFSNYKAVLNSDVDAVVLAVNPLSTHYTMAKQALQHKKDVWLEKPMTATSKEAEELISLAKENKVLLHVDHTFEYSPHVQYIKKVLDSGELGNILYVSMDRLNLGLYQQDYNVIWDLCPHDFSILNYWFGEPYEITPIMRCSSFGMADISELHISYDDFFADIRVSWRHPEKVRKTIIIGTKKTLIYDDVGANKIMIHDIKVDYNYGDYKYKNKKNILAEYYDEWEPIQLEAKHFVTCVDKRQPTLTPGESGLKVMRLLENANKEC